MLRSIQGFIRRLAAVVAVLLMAVTALSPDATASTPVADIAFQSTAPYYEPSVAVVPIGTLLRWVNATASYHSVRHDACVDEEPCPFQSIAIPPDSSFVVAPLPAGRYAYHCELHPIMRGTVLVIDASSKDKEEQRHDR